MKIAHTFRPAAPAIRPAAATATLSQLRCVSHAALLALGGVLLCQPAFAVSTERVSVASNGSQGDDESSRAAITPDGRFIAFASYASNLVAGDANGVSDIFVHDRQTGVTERVNLAGDGSEAAVGDSLAPSISADGRFVAFSTIAKNLVAGDTNDDIDIFVRDRQTGTTERVSVDSAGVEAVGNSYEPEISPDGRFVAFESDAENLVAGDTNGLRDIFVHDRQAGTTERSALPAAGPRRRVPVAAVSPL
jgi:Tol biopolymer transport system component